MNVDQVMNAPELKACFMWYLKMGLLLGEAIKTGAHTYGYTDELIVVNYDKAFERLMKTMRCYLNSDSDIANFTDAVYTVIHSLMSHEQIMLSTPELLLLEDYQSN
ncbi:hypothetical protein GCM10009122_22670 [Fulvivirga kasyanovii]|uniref:Uncharacterized protein n=1 Tax=Fulvivirga kasyanovii TaxID=396812 RepID=A0ABW9RNM3_9BACT|nr:hypothetical protein [Fulvivirga kasyanovii]MTI25747.1 hypothetical protein [Fulvivirga kasyanovii]